MSFDLVNEPPSVGQYGMTRENHEQIMRRTIAAIRAITLDGLSGGHEAIPELADAGVTHRGRAYGLEELTNRALEADSSPGAIHELEF